MFTNKQFSLTKRIVATSIAACMLLTGCSPKAKPTTTVVKLDPKSPVSIEVWHYYNDVQKAGFDSMVDEFNNTVGREKGIIVEAFSQGNVNQLIQKVLDSAEGKVGAEPIPNIFAAYADTAYQVDSMGLLAKLNNYITPEEIAEFVPGFVSEGLDSDGNLKIFPTGKSTEIFMMNRTDWDKFATATGATTDSLATIEDLVKTAEQYYKWTDSNTKASNDGKALFGRDAMANYMIIGSRQLGKEIFEVKNDGSVVINDDKEIMRKLWDNMYVPSVNGWFASYGRFRSDDVKTGDIISLVGSLTSAAYFPQKVNIDDSTTYPIDTTILPAPAFKDGEKFAVQQGAGMAVSASDPEHEYASVVFLKWLTTKEQNMDFSLSSGYLPVRKDSISSASLTEFFGSSEAGKYTEVLKNSLLTASKMLETSTPYCNRPFSGGSKARNVLDHSMSDKIKADLAEIQLLVDSGKSRSEAAATFTTDANFDAWYTQFHSALIACIAAK